MDNSTWLVILFKNRIVYRIMKTPFHCRILSDVYNISFYSTGNMYTNFGFPK